MNVKETGFRRAGAKDVAALTALQRAAYAPNRDILGVEPLPLLADYAEIVANKECWLTEFAGRLDGVLILEAEGDALLIWSIAVAPHAQGSGLGNRMMAFAAARAEAAGRARLVLYTGEKLEKNIAWYQRSGFVVTRIETRTDRNIVHMEKPLTTDI